MALRLKDKQRMDNVLHKKLKIKKSHSLSDVHFGKFQSEKVRVKFLENEVIKLSENTTQDDDHYYAKNSSHDNEFQTVIHETKRKLVENDYKKSIKQECASRNAISSRIHRNRKKICISSLERENENLRQEINEINKKFMIQNKHISALKYENTYLKGLLANSKELGEISINLKEVTGLPVTTSLIKIPENMNNKDTFKTDVNHLSECENINKSETNKYLGRSINFGFNSTILSNDVYLDSAITSSIWEESSNLEKPLFEFENDFYDSLLNENFNESSTEPFFNLGSQSLDLNFENSNNINCYKDNDLPPADICLHVNQKTISVEIIKKECQVEKNEHFRHLLLFAFNQGSNAAKASRDICAVYGEGSISERSARDWYAKFKKGNFDLRDAPRSGRPAKFDEKVLNQLLHENSRQSTRVLAKRMECSHTAIEKHLRSIGRVQSCGAWISRPLKTMTIIKTQSNLQEMRGRSDEFFKSEPMIPTCKDREVEGT